MLPSSMVISQNFGDFASAIYIRNCMSTTFYNTTGSGADCINPTCATEFQINFGTFNQNSNGLEIRGGEIKTWKNGGGNVCSARLNYVVYPTGSRPAIPIFTVINLPFKCGCNSGTFADGLGPCSGNDQKWSVENFGPIDITDRALGNYTIEIYYDYTGDDNSSSLCRDTKYINNGNNPTNYTGTFTVVSSGGACALLPVELINFVANCYDNDVKISWSTASENRNDFFTVEKSIDGENWNEIGKIESKGNSSKQNNYIYFDKETNIKASYYRLKQTDFDGFVSVYDPIGVECYEDNSTFFELYPNPSNGQSFDVFLKEKNRKGYSNLSIFDTRGTLVFQENIEVKSGINSYHINKNLYSGIYFVEINNGEGYKQTRKIIVY